MCAHFHKSAVLICIKNAEVQCMQTTASHGLVVGGWSTILFFVVGRISLVNKHGVRDAAGSRPITVTIIASAQSLRGYYRCYRYQRNGVNVQQYECRCDFSRCAMEYLARMPVEHGGGLLSNQTEKPHHYTWASEALPLFLQCLQAVVTVFNFPPVLTS